MRRALPALLLLLAAPSFAAEPLCISLLDSVMVHFHADSAAKYAVPGDSVLDRGRLVTRPVELPALHGPHRIFADLTLIPTPKTEREVFDRWDRAGDVRLLLPGQPPVELVRFMTSYGGRTTHTVEVSDLSPLLRGAARVGAFVDTWLSPAWRVDCRLRYLPDTTYDNPTWAQPVLFEPGMNHEQHGPGITARVNIPAGMRCVVLRVLSTGHCTDGTDEDEFVSKAKVISVDGHVVHRMHPWRDDCRAFRDRNPYTARWTDGSWSSDYARSGWCPGDVVRPLEVDLTDALPPGAHTISYRIEDIRPRNPRGDFGYWHVSAALVGWDHPPRLWRN